MNINNREKYLFIVLIFTASIFVLNMTVFKPINSKINDLNYEKEQIVEHVSKLDSTEAKKPKKSEKDIVIDVERELSSFVNIEYINKFVEWDENNKDIEIIELKIKGSIENIFALEDKIANLNLHNNIRNIQINKIPNNNMEDEEQIQENLVDCIMTLKVG